MSKIGTYFFRFLFETGDEMRMKKLKQDLSDISIRGDIPYMDDGDRGHLFDIYTLKQEDKNRPVMINIHGGGLFASYKEVNSNFNYEWARIGFNTVSISYRRIPEVYLKDQVSDVMTALRYVFNHADELGLNMKNAFLTGDSAGALLSHFVLSINGSSKLQEAFGEDALGFDFKAAGLISIFLDTQRTDLMKSVSDRVLAKGDENRAFAQYILDPVLMVKDSVYPPMFLVTGKQDLIENDTLKYESAQKASGTKVKLLSFPEGKERKLDHVFAVKFPKWPESREVYKGMTEFFEEVDL